MVPAVVLLAHLVGLVLGVGGATTKLVLLVRSRIDHAFVPVYLQVAGPITRLIVSGLVLLTLSGIGWLVLGYPMTTPLVTKLVLVAAIWVIGPIIDRGIEPKFRSLALAPEGRTGPTFRRVHTQYLALEVAATLLFYVVIVYWVLTTGHAS